MTVPTNRIKQLNDRPTNRRGEFVLYWMVANRRIGWNFSLQRAVEHAERIGKPLVVLEALRCDYQWASDRIHRFVLDGMTDNRTAFAETKARYFAYVEPETSAGAGLLESLAAKACVVVTDELPCFFIPRMLRSVAARLPVTMEAVDSNGILPLRATDRVFPTAQSFRRCLQKELPNHFGGLPSANPLQDSDMPELDRLPRGLLKRWPETTNQQLASDGFLASLPIDHQVSRTSLRGGSVAAEKVLERFVSRRLCRYADERNVVDDEVASGLSPYLHFGHVSAHQVFARIVARESWSDTQLAEKPTGSRNGWWGMSPESESFLDELITWRELGYNMCSKQPNYDQYESLPDWARKTIECHQADARPYVYSLDELDEAETHDPIWNAAQTQLVAEGRIHNYLRMLWGKKIFEWSLSPQDALNSMIELNNRYAIDGRNPNSYSGIFWCLGRYDRAWGPERKIFGKIRYMSSDNTARKVRVKEYIHQYSANSQRTLF